MRNRKNRQKTPWGRIFGLLMAVLVTLICIVRGVEPVVIVQRSFVAFIAVGAITASVIFVLEGLNGRSSETTR